MAATGTADDPGGESRPGRAPGATARDGGPTPGPGWRTARIVTEVTAPAILVATMFLLLGWYSSRESAAGLAWGLLAAVFGSLIPFVYILGNVRRGRLTDHHVGVREQRRVPLLVGLASVAVGLLLMAALGAPRAVLALTAAGAVGLAVSVTVSHWWKMSIHSAVASGAAVILVLVFGPALFGVWPVLGLIGWSRVRLGDHTVPQVLVGGVIGALVAGAVFTHLR